MGWETENAEGLRGAFDPEQRDKEMDADGVAAEVIFADADAITGMASPPFGAGLSAGMIDDPELAFAGARAHNRFLVELCSHSPERRGGIALVPITHDVERGGRRDRVAGRPARHPGRDDPDDVARPTCPTTTPPTTRCGPRARPPGFPVHTHSGEAPREEMGEHIGIYLAEVVWWATRPMWHLLFSGAFERFPGLKFVVTEAAAYWVHRHDVEVGPVPGGRAHDQEDGRADEGQDLQAAVGLLRHEHLHRGLDHVEGGDPPPPRHRLRRRDVGHRLPAPRGHVAPHAWPGCESDFGDVPVEDTRKLLGETAARCYGFDLDALRPIAERVGPTPEDLGQDPDLRTDPDEVANARWWKAEYDVQAPV